MNGVFAAVEGDLLRETNDFARASSVQHALRIQEAEDLQASRAGSAGRVVWLLACIPAG